MKILLLEDNKTLNETITLKLENKGYEVCTFIDGEEALNNITEGFLCFILDINVPNVNGIEILKKIREFYDEIPVIIISSTVELDIIKKSYDLGCNDFLKKPFFIDELEIKVEKLCKVSTNVICFDKDVSFNFNQRTIVYNEKEIKLTQKENMLLNLFLLHKNSIVTYNSIENYVWEGKYTSLDSIRTLVKRLRKKLPKTYLEVSSNGGYRFLLH